MNVLTETWRQLVRRRLWPIAVLLVAALAAVPVVLAKPAAPAPAPPVAAAKPAAADTPNQSYVHLTSDDPATTGKVRRVLGAPKDPFEPAPLPKVKHVKKKVVVKAAAKRTPKAAAKATATPVSATAPSAGPVSVPVATATPAPKKPVTPNSVEVRFGLVSGPMARSTLTRLKTLPSASSPLAVFMGFAKGGRAAVFMLTGTVAAEGDGSCAPNPQSCQTLELRKGQTEFLTFSGTAHDGEYELDVNDLHASKSASASAAALVASAAATATATATASATATATATATP